MCVVCACVIPKPPPPNFFPPFLIRVHGWGICVGGTQKKFRRGNDKSREEKKKKFNPRLFGGGVCGM